MSSIISALKGVAVIAGTLIFLVPLSRTFPDFGVAVACAVISLGVITAKWPLPFVWLDNKFTSISIAALGSFALVISSQTIAENKLTHEAQLIAAKEAKLAGMRVADPVAYLNELKATNDKRWESEYEVLDKRGYEKFTLDRRVKLEQERKEKVSKLLEESKNIAPSDAESLRRVYANLTELEPNNRDFKLRLDGLEKQISLKKEAQALLEMQQQYPERYVVIEKFSWSKGGFGSVMIANFSVKNNLPWAIKDIEIQCTHSAPSGTTIDRNKKTIYERVEANKSRRINNFSMGFIHSQASRSGCDIIRVVAIR